MPLSYILILALIQGTTEFLPVSSSAHLELFHKAVGQTDDDLILDVAVHVGTLAAVVLFYRAEVAMALRGTLQICRGRLATYEAHLALSLFISTIPVAIAGGILYLTGGAEVLRSLAVIGWAMILFGALLWWLDRTATTGKAARQWTLKDALVMGLWQMLALIPGTSRSGAAITGGLALGYARSDAAKLAMLMSIPTITISGLLLGLEVVRSENVSLGRDAVAAAGLAFIAGLAALALMMRLLRSVSFTPYVVYRMILGVVLLWIAYA